LNVLAVDQARKGGWCVMDYDTKKIVAIGMFDFPANKYTFIGAVVEICDLVEELMEKSGASAVFIEDIQLRRNVSSFKKLAQLQGALAADFERREYLYDFIPPTRWQSYCNARGRSEKEKKAKLTEINTEGKKASKQLSIQYVKEKFGIETADDNLADAICICDYVVNNIEIRQR